MEELSKLIAGLPYERLRGSIHRQIRNIVYHSDRITKDCLFVCIRGAQTDGHRFAALAAAKQAAAILVEDICEYPEESPMTMIKVPDTREALALTSHCFFGYPARRLKMIGITGTKGKTTTARMIRDILAAAGIRVGYIGTLGIDCGYGMAEGTHTTPESYVIAEALAQMVQGGCEAAVVEASSIGLKMQRLCGMVFHIGVYLNFGNDHVGTGEHKDAEEYFRSKAKLFRQCRIGIFNADDRTCGAMVSLAGCETVSFFGEGQELCASCIQRECAGARLGVSFAVPELMRGRIYLPLAGRFNVENALAAIAVCKKLSIEPAAIREGLRNVSIPGRMENASVCPDYPIYIDYAHNAMALAGVLQTLREYCPRRLICLFGCGGNRSRDRRFEMGETSGRLADLSIVTSDNPRYEDPEAIIDDILTGMHRTAGRYVRITDRREAIAYALKVARAGDIVLLAGKGHETYQEIYGKKYPMDERMILEELSGGR
ncbi:MAG: UDP-N-acetylmuramoyl-L-alanyl-D-glutamate--2,6-diaminopimelate ligase [Lachnospiraceae bacterium]|nr:UDP-N-acetylmuramoyl-L-alanyl-D-glutamate--2,6-diaminopimelate ligase [Lachnospiraceae bacterium]